MSRQSRNNQDEGIITFVALMLIVVFALPLVGAYFLTKPEKKTLGIILLVVGLVLWVILGVASA